MASGQVSPKRGKVVDIPANAPTSVTATAGASSASVAFTAPNTSTGGPVFYYTVISNPGSVTATGTSSPITVPGLTPDTSYTFTVAGTNPTGFGPYSSASNSIVAEGTAFDSIATVTATGGETTLAFTSIPQTFAALQIRGLYRDDSTGVNAQASMRIYFNNDTTNSNYTWHRLQGDGVSSNAFGSGTNSFLGSGTGSGVSNTLSYGANIFNILDYASTSKLKTVRGFAGADLNNAAADGAQVHLTSNLWKSTSAITQINLNAIYQSFAAGTTFALYGIKG